MVKSAKHCFNDITIHHFDSFLEAVAELDPEVDEYPLIDVYKRQQIEQMTLPMFLITQVD